MSRPRRSAGPLVGPSPRRLAVALAGALVFAAPALAAAQAPDPTRPLIRGRVIDAETRTPLRGAMVFPLVGEGGVLTDSLGVFVLQMELAGTYRLSVEQLGYATMVVDLPPTAPGEFTTVLLRPNPIALEGLEVLVDRFERRRRFHFGPVRAIEQDRLLRSARSTAYDVVRGEVPLARPCPRDAVELCFWRRGREERVRLCIDEVRALGGALDLEAYDPRELYLVEIYDRGREVRVYTRWFVDGRLRTGRRLAPLAWGC